MKQINDLGIMTLEGLSIKNLQRFPSMEWGPEGGMSADIYYKGVKVVEVFQEGNGGCASASITQAGEDILGEIRDAGLTFLRRVDKAYGPNTQYSWLKNKTVKNFNDDDWEAVVNSLENRYEDVALAAKRFTQGYKAVAIVTDPVGRVNTLAAPYESLTIDIVETYLTVKCPEKKWDTISIIRASDKLSLY